MNLEKIISLNLKALDYKSNNITKNKRNIKIFTKFGKAALYPNSIEFANECNMYRIAVYCCYINNDLDSIIFKVTSYLIHRKEIFYKFKWTDFGDLHLSDRLFGIDNFIIDQLRINQIYDRNIVKDNGWFR